MEIVKELVFLKRYDYCEFVFVICFYMVLFEFSDNSVGLLLDSMRFFVVLFICMYFVNGKREMMLVFI